MYLAEDRVLCLEIFARKKYILKYLPDSVAWFQFFFLNKFYLILFIKIIMK